MIPDIDTLRFTPALAFEIKAGAAQGVIEGLASTFGGAADAYGDVVERGAFAVTLARHRDERSAPAMLWAHDAARVVGQWTHLTETAEGLAVRGQLNLNTVAGRDAFEHVKAGDLRGLSVGYRTIKSRHAKAARVLLEVDLAEVSLVALPANRRARITEVKSLGSRAELRDLLHEAGLPRAAAEKVATAGWPALATPETLAAELVPELRALAALFTKG